MMAEHEKPGLIEPEELWSALNLVEVTPFALSYKSRSGGFKDLPDPVEEDETLGVETGVMLQFSEGLAVARMRAVISTERFVIETDNGAYYENQTDRRLSADSEQMLVKHAIMAMYPYIREQVSSLSGRGGDSVTLGILPQDAVQVGDREPVRDWVD